MNPLLNTPEKIWLNCIKFSVPTNQATDRAHRIGQEKKVTVYKLIAKDTVEEAILDLQEAKSQLAQGILTAESVSSTSLQKGDLLKILG